MGQDVCHPAAQQTRASPRTLIHVCTPVEGKELLGVMYGEGLVGGHLKLETRMNSPFPKSMGMLNVSLFCKNAAWPLASLVGRVEVHVHSSAGESLLVP